MHDRALKSRRELVLVGGGHAHIQVLTSLAMAPLHQARVTVVVDTPIAVYSGMVPGMVARRYRAEELEIDVVPLARRAGARVVIAAAVAVDPVARTIALDGRPPIHYDVASLDVGSTVAGLDLPGVREHALASRPIGVFAQRIEELLSRARELGRDRTLRVVVVGGGAGGVELAFTTSARLRAQGLTPEVTLVHTGERILAGSPRSLVSRLHRRAAAAGITFRSQASAVAAEADAVVLASGERLRADAILWVSGAVTPPLVSASALPRDARGFVLVRDTLQVEGFDDLFAVGDCATLATYPWVPKAGVYAVRQGPFLTANLRSHVLGEPLAVYQPQRDFLLLLNLGDGTAVGSRSGLSFEGRWVMRLKDWIDRRFMHRFQVLEASGALADGYREAPPMAGMSDMRCGGCAAKVGQSVLERALGRLGKGDPEPSVVMGLDAPDDATAIRTPKGDVVVASIDGFRAFTDDPYLVGRVAAVNACSDVWAKGATPRYAQAIVSLPEGSDIEVEETLFQVLAGARDTFDLSRVTLLGGHTITGAELMVGFHIEGFAPGDGRLLRIGGLVADQRLILTKALGTGVVLRADMLGRARGAWLQATYDSLVRLNAEAGRVAVSMGATAATDVTGFGLAGHLGEMARRSGVCAVVDLGAIPALPGSVELFRSGFESTYHQQNARARRGIVIEPAASVHERLPLLFDPQTSGGLVFGVAASAVAATLAQLHEAGDEAATMIGEVVASRPDGAPLQVVAR